MKDINTIARLVWAVVVNLYARAKKWLLALIAVIFSVGCATTTTFPYHGGTGIDAQCDDASCEQLAKDTCPNGNYTLLASTTHSITFVCSDQPNNLRRDYLR